MPGLTVASAPIASLWTGVRTIGRFSLISDKLLDLNKFFKVPSLIFMRDKPELIIKQYKYGTIFKVKLQMTVSVRIPEISKIQIYCDIL